VKAFIAAAATKDREETHSKRVSEEVLMGEYVNLTVEDGVGTIRIDRPKLNPLNAQVATEIGVAVDDAAGRDDVRAVVVWGGERVFAAGADIKEMSAQDAVSMFRFIGRFQDVFTRLENLPMVTIGAGGTQRLPRLIGVGRAKEMVFSGRFVGAEEALRIGLVNEVVAPESVYERAVEVARGYAQGPRVALMAAKQAIHNGMQTDMSSALLIERQAFSALFATEDQKTGMDSFLEYGPGKATFAGR
jgi:enoyl-CoA hydratase